MLRRLEFIQFHEFVPYAAFGFTAAIFFFVVYRTIKMKPRSAEHLASLPVDDDRAPPASHSSSPSSPPSPRRHEP